jgi:hypothetical protein
VFLPDWREAAEGELELGEVDRRAGKRASREEILFDIPGDLSSLLTLLSREGIR